MHLSWKPYDVQFDNLRTYMSEVIGIMNARFFVKYSNRSSNVLSLSIHNTYTRPIIVQILDLKMLFKVSEKLVKKLADVMWCKWQREYIHCMQSH